MTFTLGVDVGGTFTDFLLVGDSRRLVHKTSSTPGDPSLGLINGLGEIAARLELEPADFVAQIELIVHGTTVATNAVLTRSGAASGMLVTRGFRDVLRLRDGTREETYNNRLQPPEPLVPRYLTHGIGERIAAAGAAVEALDEDAVRDACAQLTREGVNAVAISFLHSPQNDAHERRAAAIVREEMPGAYVTASSELLPAVRFWPRTSTTVLNTYVGPIITAYMDALTRRLRELRFAGLLLVMQSNGGVATPPEAAARAALTLLSGPASAPVAGIAALAPHELADCITIDMGGTSFDAALVRDGAPLVMTDGVMDRWRLSLPMIDIHTIGAGGGSIAWVDEGGLLQVGPASAGAQPGPACYGRGGTLPTVTDADLVLGFLDESGLLGGEMRLDRDAAERAILEHVAGPLGLDVLSAAAGIIEVVDVTMAAGVREVTVRRGFDARNFPIVVAGGAGPVHAAAIARELDIPLLLVPRESSIFCASGMLMCDFKHDYVRALKRPLEQLTPAELQGPLDAMAVEGIETLSREGVARERVRFRASLDVRYVGQWHEIDVPFAWQPGSSVAIDAIATAFHEQHDRMFGYASPSSAVEMLAIRLGVVGETVKPELDAGAADGAPDAAGAVIGQRLIWSGAAGALVDAPVYDGHRLGAGATLAGPAIVALDTTTIVVPADFELLVDRFGAFVLHSGERGRDAAAAFMPGTLGSVAT